MTTTPSHASTGEDLAADVAEARITRFLRERTGVSWEPDADLFESGTVSSLFAMELVVFLEGFGVAITGTDLRLANFRTVRTMTDLVLRLRDEDARGDD
jgi:methoxymalonate biosynthesis acyl carrier protein